MSKYQRLFYYQTFTVRIKATVSNVFDCDNANTGFIKLVVTGGALLTYSWSNGIQNKDLNQFHQIIMQWYLPMLTVASY
jgi:hypothetical protein